MQYCIRQDPAFAEAHLLLAEIQRVLVDASDAWIMAESGNAFCWATHHLSMAEQEDVLCEMNVIEQVGNVALTNVVQDAWHRGQKLALHGWCYGLKDGLVNDLRVSMQGPDDVMPMFRNGLKRYPRGVGV